MDRPAQNPHVKLQRVVGSIWRNRRVSIGSRDLVTLPVTCPGARFSGMLPPSMARALAIFLFLGAARASALPTLGTKLRSVSVVDTAGQPRAVPDARRAILVFYEDKDAGAQNVRARAALGRFTDRPENRDKFDFVPIADV